MEKFEGMSLVQAVGFDTHTKLFLIRVRLLAPRLQEDQQHVLCQNRSRLTICGKEFRFGSFPEMPFDLMILFTKY